MYYSAAGRITSRSDLGSYSYSGVNAGPHAVTSVNGVNYAYDANGRMTSRGGDAITWYSYDLAKKIESGSQSTEFSYGVDRQRYKQVQKTGSTTDATIAYLGTLMEIEARGGTTTYRHYVQARDRVVARVERVGTTNTTVYLHRDQQSSVVEVTNSSGTVIDSLAFDAWGLRRNASNWAALGSPFGGTQATERGYTGHEHLDTVGLVNMNGRIQDPTIGRFLSADPIVQAPYSSQSHNRYSYVWNNPLRYTDPSGFEADQDEWIGDEITVTESCGANVSCTLRRQRDAGVAFQRWMDESQRQFEDFVKSCSDAQTPQGGVPNAGAARFADAVAAVGTTPGSGSTLLPSEVRKALGVAWWAVNQYNPASVSSNTEYAGLVYRNAAGDFIATEAVMGAPCVGTAVCSSQPWDALSLVPCGASCVVLDWHTHGSDAGSPGVFELFSNQDIRVINTQSTRRGAPDYLGQVLGTPQGQSYFYRPGTLAGGGPWPATSRRAAQIPLQPIAK